MQGSIVNMNRTNMIVADVLFVVVLVMICNTDGFKTYPVIFIPLVIVAFATCVVRHINYYNTTKRIY